jgi:hypothetical protein
MLTTLALSLAAAVLPVAPVAAPVAAPVTIVADTVFAPAGKYELFIDIQGTQLGVGMELWQEEGKWLGTIASQQMGATNLQSVAFDKDKRLIKIELPAPGGEGTVYGELTLKTDNTVAGTLYVAGQSISLTGKKIVE